MSLQYQGGLITATYNMLLVPDSPTIGTATGGNAQASVTFTAPTDVGGSAVTSYTVISSPSGIMELVFLNNIQAVAVAQVDIELHQVIQ